MTEQHTEPATWLTLSHLADLLPLSKRQLQKLALAGEIPGAVKLGSQYGTNAGESALLAWWAAYQASVANRRREQRRQACAARLAKCRARKAEKLQRL